MEDAELVRERYTYDPETGEWLWRKPHPKSKKTAAIPGQPAGTVDHKDGSRLLNLDGKIRRASQMAWLYVKGEWPPGQVLYKDPTLPLPTRDRFENLKLPGAHGELSQEELHRLVSYDRESGEMRWAMSRKGIHVGQLAGSERKTSDGRMHRYVRIDGVEYVAARLAWFHVHGVWPSTRLAFRNDRPLDLSLENLYESEFEHGTRATPDISEEERRIRQARNYRRYELKKNYNLTPAEWEAIHDAQDGLCAICRKPETALSTNGKGEPAPLNTDHDHETGVVRELLCAGCNKTLGHCDDDADALVAMIAYLAKHGKPRAIEIMAQLEPRAAAIVELPHMGRVA